MKFDKWVTAAIAAVLAFLLAFGAAGSMVTAFALPLKSYPTVLAIWWIAAIFSAGAFSRRWGGLVVLCLGALFTGYLLRRGDLLWQVLHLMYRISSFYDNAYGCGVFLPLDLSGSEALMDLPMSILGSAVAIAGAWTVCRGKSGELAITLALLPLFSCLVVTDTVPGTGNLFALILGILVLLFTCRVRSGDPFQGNRLTFLVAVPTALALAGVFLAAPKESYVNKSAALRDGILTWFQTLPDSLESVQKVGGVHAPGQEPEQVKLSTLGRRVESTVPVMDVTAEVGGTLYLRGQDYDVYDGTGWQASGHRVENFSYEGIPLGTVSIETRSELEQLYLPYFPAGGQSLVGGKVDNPRLYTKYSFSRTGLQDNWSALSAAAEDTGAGAAAYLSLPETTRAGAEHLLASILPESGSVPEKAAAIGAYVRDSAEYDLNTGRMPAEEPDFALWFLNKAETGYCVHFATAAVVLLRAAGIEARYVSGYMARVQPGVTATVTGENAHAWAEYYVPGLDAWLVLEATPAAGSTVPATAAANTQPTQPSTQPEVPTTKPEEPSSVPATRPPAPKPSGEAPEPEAPEPGKTWGLVKLLLLIFAAGAIAEGQRKLRFRLRRRMQRTGSPNAQALARWRETELLARLLGEAPPQALEELALKAKFSQHILPPEELAQFESHLRAARKRLGQQSWYRKLINRYLYAVM